MSATLRLGLANTATVFLQTVFLILLSLSLAWIHHYGEAHNLADRGLWTRIESNVFASFTPAFCLGLFSSEFNRPFRAFIFTVLWGYILTMVWCAYWEISYALPVVAAALTTLFYKDIRTEDYRTSNRTIAATILLIWFIAAFAVGLFFGYMGYESDMKKQEYANQAIEIAPIKAVDCKDNYIYTEEYGLEKMHTPVDVPKGSKVHRLPLGDEGVFIVVE